MGQNSNNIVDIRYQQTGESSATNELGMREMQAKAYEARNKRFLLIKAPPTSLNVAISVRRSALLFPSETEPCFRNLCASSDGHVCFNPVSTGQWGLMHLYCLLLTCSVVLWK